MKTILLVDDEPDILELLTYYLKTEGYQTVSFTNGTEALDYAITPTNHIDLAILDVMLPDISGFEISRKIRKNKNFPIIMLTAKDDALDKISGFTMGADDYITKPFQPLELIARVKAHLRRYTLYNEKSLQISEDDPKVIYHRGLMINKDSRECFVDDQLVKLTPKEFDILWILLENIGKVISSEELFQMIWQEKYYEQDNNTIMVHIRHIRQKIDSTQQKYIQTVWGVGYKIE